MISELTKIITKIIEIMVLSFIACLVEKYYIVNEMKIDIYDSVNIEFIFRISVLFYIIGLFEGKYYK